MGATYLSSLGSYLKRPVVENVVRKDQEHKAEESDHSFP